MAGRDRGIRKRRWAAALAPAAAYGRRVAARPGAAHLIRAWQRFSDRMGNQFAAAITYFSFLSLVPIVMVGFSVAGIILSAQPSALADLKGQITRLMPSSGLGDKIGTLIDHAVGQSLTVGIVGLVIAAYSGLSWMGNVRDAVHAQWRPQWDKPPRHRPTFLMRYVWDLVTLSGLLVAILISFSLTAVGTAANGLVMRLLHVGEGSFLSALLGVGPFIVAVGAGMVIFGWMYTALPDRRERADRRTLVIGAAAMSVVFEVLKAALAVLVARMSSSPSGAVFGSVIGLLLLFNLVARAFLMVAAWMSTAGGQTDAAGSVRA